MSTIAVIDIVNDYLLEGPELFELCFQLDEEEENRKITPGDPESAVVTIADDPPDGRKPLLFVLLLLFVT